METASTSPLGTRPLRGVPEPLHGVAYNRQLGHDRRKRRLLDDRAGSNANRSRLQVLGEFAARNRTLRHRAGRHSRSPVLRARHQRAHELHLPARSRRPWTPWTSGWDNGSHLATVGPVTAAVQNHTEVAQVFAAGNPGAQVWTRYQTSPGGSWTNWNLWAPYSVSGGLAACREGGVNGCLRLWWVDASYALHCDYLTAPFGGQWALSSPGWNGAPASAREVCAVLQGDDTIRVWVTDAFTKPLYLQPDGTGSRKLDSMDQHRPIQRQRVRLSGRLPHRRWRRERLGSEQRRAPRKQAARSRRGLDRVGPPAGPGHPAGLGTSHRLARSSRSGRAARRRGRSVGSLIPPCVSTTSAKPAESGESGTRRFRAEAVVLSWSTPCGRGPLTTLLDLSCEWLGK